MTDTIDSLSEKTEADLTPGDLCWVQAGEDAPTTARHQRVMAVYTQGVGSNRWLLLIPNGDNPSHGTHGWVLGSNLMERQMTRLNITRFVDTHRGWWAGHRPQFIETCSGHWCVTHQAFHATPTCPPEDPWARLINLSGEVDASVLSGLRTQLAEAQTKEAAAVKALEDFKTRVIEVGGQAAEDNDWCSVYDQIMDQIGLTSVQTHEIAVDVTFRAMVHVDARSRGLAESRVRDSDIEVDVSVSSDYEMSVSIPGRIVQTIVNS